ncbi:MAG: archaeal proteasome endopeptidase complex subunit beta [Candidatus Ranarchaeia archaeon]
MVDDNMILKSGTTTVGVRCTDGVVLATESQATMGYLVASDKAPKLYKITDEIAVTMAGGVADCQMLIRQVRALANLRSIELDRKISIRSVANTTANILFQNRYYPLISQLIIGGVDAEGPHLFTLDPLGSLLEEKKFASTGSGSVMAYGVLEDSFKENMDVKQGIELVKKAIESSRRRDIASGGDLQIAVITKDGFKKIQ